MGADLKYNLEEYSAAVSGMAELMGTIGENKDEMRKALEQIETDWTTEGGVAFIKDIDESWAQGVQTCIDAIEDLTTVLNDAYAKYAAIEEDSKQYLKID